MSVLLLLSVVAVITNLTLASESLNVKISPEHAHVTSGTELEIMCKADKPLTHCHFQINRKRLYDLSEGYFAPGDTEFTYFGEGLEYGDCGMRLATGHLPFTVHLVGCRVRTSHSDWIYAEMSLIIKDKTEVPVEISPGRQVIVLPGKPLRVMVDAKQPLSHCSFIFTNEESGLYDRLRFNFNGNDTTPDESNPRETGIEYYGAGMASGQCGMQVSRATEVHNHGIWVDASTDADHEGTNFFRLIVAKVPNTPYMFTNTTVNSDGTTLLNAWCSVTSRPQSSLSWFLGEERIPEEHLEFIRTDGWIWPSRTSSVKQKLTLVLNSTANDKELWCTATHVALQAPKESKRRKIRIVSTPSTPVLELRSYALSEDSWLEASCSVEGGESGVEVTWYMGSDVLRRDGNDDDPQPPTVGRSRITQKLRHFLQAEDNGQVLRCEVTHPALPQPLQATRQIRFTHCPPLTSSTVQISCSLADEFGECGTPQQVGTIAQLSCKPGHAVADNSVVYRSVKCTRYLTWDRPVFSCTPSCGKRNTKGGTVLITGGEDSDIGEFPWHAGIYNETSPTNVMQICGGTLITPNMIVSAAHCFKLDMVRRTIDPSFIKVALGKHARAWEEVAPHIQKRNVSQVVVPLSYSGITKNFASDIALLRLTWAVEITGFVNIVCIDWENFNERKQLKAGNNGTVAGWGYTENDRYSDELKYVDLPYVDYETCKISLKEYSQRFLTHDKFCAGHLNKSISVCHGDSGGGLVFRDLGTDRYYLRGITSIAFRPRHNRDVCYSQHYTAFTQLSSNIQFIRENI